MKKSAIETLLWLMFMVAAAVHVFVIFNYQGTKLEWAIFITLAVAIFNCGVACGWSLANPRQPKQIVSEEQVFVRSQPLRERSPRPQPVRRAYGSSYDDEFEVENGRPRYDYNAPLGSGVGTRRPRPNGNIRRARTS